MRINSKFQNSIVFRLFNFLFKDDYVSNFNQTKIGIFLSRLYLPYITEIFLISALFLFFYEGFVSRYVPFLGTSWLAPSLIVLSFLFSNKKKAQLKKIHVWYLIFLTIVLFSTFTGLALGVGKLTLLSGFYLFLQFGLVILAVQTIDNKERFLSLLVFLGVPLAIVGLYQFFFTSQIGSLWLTVYEGTGNRAFAFFGSPNVLGIVLSFLLFLALSFSLKNKNSIYLLFSIVFLVAIFATLSRTAWLGLIFGGLVFAFFYYKKALLFAPLALATLLVAKVRARFSVLFDQRFLFDSFLDGRIWSVLNGIYLAKKFPFGTGPGSYGGKLAYSSASPVYLEGMQNGYTALYYADNQYIQLLVQTGFLGLLSFVGFIISSFMVLVKKGKKKDPIALAALAVLVSFTVSGMFANVLEFSAVAVLAAIIFGSVVND